MVYPNDNIFTPSFSSSNNESQNSSLISQMPPGSTTPSDAEIQFARRASDTFLVPLQGRVTMPPNLGHLTSVPFHLGETTETNVVSLTVATNSLALSAPLESPRISPLSASGPTTALLPESNMARFEQLSSSNVHNLSSSSQVPPNFNSPAFALQQFQPFHIAMRQYGIPQNMPMHVQQQQVQSNQPQQTFPSQTSFGFMGHSLQLSNEQQSYTPFSGNTQQNEANLDEAQLQRLHNEMIQREMLRHSQLQYNYLMYMQSQQMIYPSERTGDSDDCWGTLSDDESSSALPLPRVPALPVRAASIKRIPRRSKTHTAKDMLSHVTGGGGGSSQDSTQQESEQPLSPNESSTSTNSSATPSSEGYSDHTPQEFMPGMGFLWPTEGSTSSSGAGLPPQAPFNLMAGTSTLGAGHNRGPIVMNHPRHFCRICNKTYTRPFNLRSHMLTHEYKRPFECSSLIGSEGCATRFTRRHDLVRHIRAKHPNATLPE